MCIASSFPVLANVIALTGAASLVFVVAKPLIPIIMKMILPDILVLFALMALIFSGLAFMVLPYRYFHEDSDWSRLRVGIYRVLSIYQKEGSD